MKRSLTLLGGLALGLSCLAGCDSGGGMEEGIPADVKGYVPPPTMPMMVPPGKAPPKDTGIMKAEPVTTKQN